MQLEINLPNRQPWAYLDQMVGDIAEPVARYLAEHAPWPALVGWSWQHDHWVLSGEPLNAFMALATSLRHGGMLGTWRNEQVKVFSVMGNELGAIERATVLILGLQTRAVHLVAQSTDGRWWMQQRAFNKPANPGMWDSTVSGLMSAHEEPEQTLLREAAEEAGLTPEQIASRQFVGEYFLESPTYDQGLHGRMRETAMVWQVTLSDDVLPINRDGEVSQFALWTSEELQRVLLEPHQITPDAKVIYTDLLNQRA